MVLITMASTIKEIKIDTKLLKTINKIV